jgi:bifunctional non-homologous end joining protein LigD
MRIGYLVNTSLEQEGLMSEQPEKGPLVFVVHKHQATTLHNDFRLEIGGMMRTSAIPRGPTPDP